MEGVGRFRAGLTPCQSPPPLLFPSRVNSPQPAAKKSTFLGMKTADLFRLSEDAPRPPFLNSSFPARPSKVHIFIFKQHSRGVKPSPCLCLYLGECTSSVSHKVAFSVQGSRLGKMFRSKSLSPQVTSTGGSL